MPSLMENSPFTVIECLALGVPFLASRTGGIPELIAAEDQDEVLFPPHTSALAARLRLAFREGVAPARPAVDGAACDAAWERWHRDRAQRGRTEFIPFCGEDPLTDSLIGSGNRCVDEMPLRYRDLLRLVQGQARRIEHLEEQLRQAGVQGKPLRYHLADVLYAPLRRLPLLSRLLRRFLQR
jgi:hypothetical protein